VEDISDESGEPTEPVTLAEMKSYLRLEGGPINGAGLSLQEPIPKTLVSGKIVQDPLLQAEGVVITSVVREGLGYSQTTGTPGSRQFVFNAALGTITFAEDGDNVAVDITYGISGESDNTGDFDFDDTLIEAMITAARQRLEIYTGCSLIPKTIETVVTNLCGMVSLPAGPVTGDVSGVDSEGVEIVADSIKLVGSKFPDLKEPLLEHMVLTYEAGYATLPKGLKQAIMAEVAYRYEHRGDETEDEGMCKTAVSLANPFKRGNAFG
jgi:hypothetical protein